MATFMSPWFREWSQQRRFDSGMIGTVGYEDRKCEFCGCSTNANVRACCARGNDADRGIIPTMSDKPHDPVNHPSHYNSHPSGVETAAVTRHFSCMLGAAVKYVWRAGKKGSRSEDLRKAAWCFNDEANRIAGSNPRAGQLAFVLSPFLDTAWKQYAARVVLAQPPPDLLSVILIKLITSEPHTFVEELFACATLCEEEAARS